MDISKQKVVMAGHISLDITPSFPNEIKVKHPGELFEPGRLIQTGHSNLSIGGAIGNTGLAMKFFGANVSLLGKIGSDSLGKLLLSELEKYNAAEDIIRSDGEDTSYTIVLAIPGHDRMFLHNPGANNYYYYEDIDFNKMKDAALFHFGYPPIMKSIYENGGSELIRIFKKVKELGAATSLDMCSVDENSEAGKVDWSKYIQNILPYVDFFVPSVEELCYMIDPDKFKKWNERAKENDTDILAELSIENDIRPLADTLISWGAKVVMIKCGYLGLYLRTNTREALNDISGVISQTMKGWENIEHFEDSYVPDRILCATGAGDTSIAAFLCSILKGYSWQASLNYAAATGASCVSSYSSLDGLLTFEEMKNKIENGWNKNTFHQNKFM